MKRLEQLIAGLKNDESYRFEYKLSVYDIIMTLFYRSNQVLRGILLRLRIGGKGFIFKGSRVSILYKKYFKAGRNCILEDDVYINCLSKNGIHIANNVTLSKGSRLVATGVIRNKGEGISIGSNSAVGSNSFIGGQGGIEIGENVIIGPDVKIFSENHNIVSEDVPIRLQGENRLAVLIDDNCWIGASSIILEGVRLAKGTVVAAGAIVTKSVTEENMLVAGIPAKIQRSRIK